MTSFSSLAGRATRASIMVGILSLQGVVFAQEAAPSGSTVAVAVTDSRLACPPDAKIDEAVELIRAAYEAAYVQAKESGEPDPLIEQLTGLANQATDPAKKYALLLEAETVATQYENYTNALDILAKRAEQFQIDGLKLRGELLKRLAGPKVAADLVLFDQAADTAGQAMQAERFDVAGEAASLAVSVAKAIDREQKVELRKRGREGKKPERGEAGREPIGPGLVKKAKALESRVAAAQKLFSEYGEAVTRIKSQPDDAPAHSVVAKYLCFVRGEWQKGLPALAKSDLDGLKQVAKKEAAILADDNRDAKRLFELAGAWWSASESKGLTDDQQSAVKDHAATFYASVLEELSDPLEKQLAQSRKRGKSSGRLLPKFAKKAIAIPMKSDRPSSAFLDRLAVLKCEVTQLSEDTTAKTLSGFPIIYIRGGSYNDQPGFTQGEVAAFEQHVLQGGSLLCAGVVWPWAYPDAYGKKPADNFPLNQVGKNLGFIISGGPFGEPFLPTELGLLRGLKEQVNRGKYWAEGPSEILTKAPLDKAGVVCRDGAGRNIVVAYEMGRGRVVVFGHFDMLEQDTEILTRVIDYLMPTYGVDKIVEASVPNETHLDENRLMLDELLEVENSNPPETWAKVWDAWSREKEFLTLNGGRSAKTTQRRNGLMVADAFAGERDVFVVHPFSEKEPAVVSFAKITKDAKGTLLLKVHNCWGGDCSATVFAGETELTKINVNGDRWHATPVPFDHQDVRVVVNATQWYREHCFITYSVRLK